MLSEGQLDGLCLPQLVFAPGQTGCQQTERFTGSSGAFENGILSLALKGGLEHVGGRKSGKECFHKSYFLEASNDVVHVVYLHRVWIEGEFDRDATNVGGDHW